MERAPGIELTKIGDKDLQGQQLIYSSVTRLLIRWIERVLFEDGFFHGDLHDGNIFMSKEGEQVTLTLIDFGNSGELSSTERDGIFSLIFTVMQEDVKEVHNAIVKICVQSSTLAEKLSSVEPKLRNILGIKKDDVFNKITLIFSLLVENQIKMKKNLSQFFRALGFLESILKSAKKNVEAMGETVQAGLGTFTIVSSVGKYFFQRAKSLCGLGHCPSPDLYKLAHFMINKHSKSEKRPRLNVDDDNVDENGFVSKKK